MKNKKDKDEKPIYILLIFILSITVGIMAIMTILKDTSYNQITTDNNIIGEFTNDEYLAKNIYTEVYFTDSVKAGTYTGYMDFYIEVTDK